MQVSSQLIEELAFAACQAVDQKVRVPAQQKWIEFVMQLPIQYYQWFMENHTQEAIFAFTLVLKEHVAVVVDLFPVMDRLSSILMKWFRPNGSFARQNQEQLLKHVESTLGNFLGICLRHFFRSKANQKQIIEWMVDPNMTAHYRLYLFYYFIDSVSFIDDKTPFIEYRTMSNNFQDSIIPLILECLIPYFMNFEEAMEVNELAVMQDKMYLNEGQSQSDKSQLLLWNQFNKFTLMIFKLLEEVIAFRYNICYKEFDGEGYEDCKISFPDNLVKRIINREFLEALYNIISKLMKIDEHNYLSVCLNCLNKVLMAKTTYLVPYVKDKFMTTNLKGVYQLLCIWKKSQIKDKKTAVQIIDCNIKILTAFNLREMQTLFSSSKEMNEIYINWIVFIKELCVFVLEFEKDSLNFQNQLLLSSVELMKELIEYFRINKMTTYYAVFQEKCMEFTDKFLTYFIATDYHQIIMADQTFRSLEDLKDPLKRFFRDIKIVMTASYMHTFQRIWVICQHVYHKPGYEEQIANLLFLLMEMISEDSKYFEESIFGDDILRGRSKHLIDEEIADREELALFGQILNETVAYIQRYTDRKCQYLNHAIILFVERLTFNCIGKLTGHECIEDVHVIPTISYFLYTKMRRFRPNTRDEDFINFCLGVISSFIVCVEFENIEYIFQLLYETITRTKMAMHREYFKDTQIYKDMLQLFTNLSKWNLDQNSIRLRVLLYKSMTALCFDDLLDSYRGNIRSTIGLVKQSIEENNYLKIMYDLTGICQSIETDSIYNYFINRLMKEVNMKVLLEYLFSGLGCNISYLKDLLSLNYELINNRGCRFNSGKIVRRVYELIQYMMPSWNALLLKYGETDEGEQLCLQFYRIFTALVKQKHINICLLDRYLDFQYKSFVRLFLKSLSFMIESISQYPELTTSFYQVLQDVFVDALEPWLNNRDRQITRLINLLVEKIMYKLTNPKQFEYSRKVDLTESSSSLMEAELRIIHNFYKFIYDNRQFVHRAILMENFSFILQSNDLKNSFLIATIKIGFDYGKQYRDILNYVSNIGVNMFRYYDFDVNAIAGELGVKEEQDYQEFKRIVEAIKSKKQESWITVQFKDWVKSQCRFIELHDSSETFNDY